MAAGHSALDGWRPRIIKSLKARIVQVVGSHNAAVRIHEGSNPIGHQHPPTADSAIAATAPIGNTASRVRAIQAMTRPKAAAAKEIVAAGNSSAQGCVPRVIRN